MKMKITGPLVGLKVLDFSRVLAGPYCSMILGDMGADIIKVEQPGIGDDSRSFGPFIGEESAYYISLNRNKRSIALDLKDESSKVIIEKLVDQSDVIIENFRPGTMDKLGIGYEWAKEINPRIIFASISGFGHSGPYKEKAAYDIIVQALSGVMSINGQPDGPPTRVGFSVGDIAAGMYGVIGILGALQSRNVSGKGQFVDVAMLDCQIALLENAVARAVVSGETPQRIGSRHPSITPFEAFETKDGYMVIGVGNDKIWERFCNTIGKKDLLTIDEFKTNKLRTKNREPLMEKLVPAIKEKETSYWLEMFEDNGVPASEINTVNKMLENPQVIARDMIKEFEHPNCGKIKLPQLPIKFNDTPSGVYRCAPSIGQHTEEILKDLGLK
jgi:CoA:oxalate CoA-transferase